MNKSELIEAVKVELDCATKVEAAKIMKTVLDTIIEAAIKDGECVLPGLGKLQVVPTAPRPEKSGEINGVKYTTAAKPAGKKFKLNVLKEGKEKL